MARLASICDECRQITPYRGRGNNAKYDHHRVRCECLLEPKVMLRLSPACGKDGCEDGIKGVCPGSGKPLGFHVPARVPH